MNELVAIPAPFSTRWTDRFALDFAMSLEGSGDKPAVLLEEHGYTADDLALFAKDPLFMQRVNAYQVDLREKGLTFKLKAQVQAEMLLENSWDLVNDRDVSPAVKADLIKWTAKMAGFEPVQGKGDNNGNAVQIVINMGDPKDAPPAGIRVIDHE